jgi:hypothetical protein
MSHTDIVLMIAEVLVIVTNALGIASNFLMRRHLDKESKHIERVVENASKTE